MPKQIAIGIQNFEKLIKGGFYYIDKTNFIKEWWDSGDEVTLITRPRRFGKTLNMSMVEQFFSVNYANRGDLFEGFDIWKEEKYRQLQGTYPVIFLSFADIKETDFETTSYQMRKLLSNQYEKYSFLQESDVLSEAEKVFFKEMTFCIKREDMAFSLKQLSDFLYRYYGKKVIIILDEYDTPMQEAYIHGYWDQLVSFTRSLFNSTFKTNPYLERGLMTGITRISKESIFSDLNNLEIVTTTSNKYATSFGFTEEEVFNALDEFGLGNEKEQVKEWYDGFVFGKIKDIYNPWSILNFLNKGQYTSYWANTSGNGLVKKLLREGNSEIKEQLSDLMERKVLRVPVDEQIVYNQLDMRQDAIWSLLLASGYLKVLRYDRLELLQRGERACYDLQLTNHEVEIMFEDMVREWFGTKNTEYNKFIKAMLHVNLKEMNIYMNEISMDIFSYFDTGKRASRLQPERFYHGFVLGLIVDLAKDYVITSNRESGYGRYDIMIEPKNKENRAYIIEFKIHEPDEGEESLKDTVQSALKQIDEMKYEAALTAKGIAKDKIVKYGFAFEGKKVLIGAGE